MVQTVFKNQAQLMEFGNEKRNGIWEREKILESKALADSVF